MEKYLATNQETWKFDPFHAVILHPVSSNGKTAVSKTDIRGSNPCLGAIIIFFNDNIQIYHRKKIFDDKFGS